MSMSEMISQVADLSLSDKLALIESVVASIRKEGGMPAKKKKAEKAEKAEKVTSDKPKRKAALGTRAWQAYVKHCKETMPASFEGLTKESDKLVIIKGIRAEDPEGYKAFTEAWKTEHAEVSEASDLSEAETASVAEEGPEPVPEPVVVVAKPAAKPKTVKVAAVKAAVPAAVPAAAAAVPVPAAKAKAAPKAKAVKTAKVEEVTMPQKEIDGTPYWHDPKTNGLWEVTGPTVIDGTGQWIGYFQPDNEEEPIRFTEAFGDE
jgi:hypothetical protein